MVEKSIELVISILEQSIEKEQFLLDLYMMTPPIDRSAEEYKSMQQKEENIRLLKGFIQFLKKEAI